LGRYSFNQLSGPASNPADAPGVSSTGTYRVVLSLPSTLTQVGAPHDAIVIRVGGTDLIGMNFSVVRL
jgi:hypothetical protein